jgi:regulator of nonsense transcripts 3
MTQAEFVSILGSEWELGKGKVDWFSFAGGKISTEYGTEHCNRVLHY